MNFWLHIADIFLTVFHTSLMIFNLVGWLIPATRRLNLLTLLLTFGSWTFLGYWYGWGYCPLTDWHFNILEKLGYRHLPPSYLQFMLARFAGWSIPTRLADIITVGGLAIAAVGSVTVNLRGLSMKGNRARKH
jgi:hypothetical protein